MATTMEHPPIPAVNPELQRLESMVLPAPVQPDRTPPSVKALAKTYLEEPFGKSVDATVGLGQRIGKAPFKAMAWGAKEAFKHMPDFSEMGAIEAYDSSVERGGAVALPSEIMSFELGVGSNPGEVVYEMFKPEEGEPKNIHALARVVEGANVSAEQLAKFELDLGVNLDRLGLEDHRLPLEDLEGMLNAAVKRALDKHQLHGKVAASALMIGLFDKPVPTEDGPVGGPWAIIANYGDNEVMLEDEHEIKALETEKDQLGFVTSLPLSSVDKIWLSNYNAHNQDASHSTFTFNVNRGEMPEVGRDWSRIRRIAGIVGASVVAGATAGVARRGEGRFNFPAAGLAAAGVGTAGALLEHRRNRRASSEENGPRTKKGINEYDIAHNKEIWKSLSHEEQKQYSEFVQKLQEAKASNPDSYLSSKEYKNLYTQYRKFVRPIINRHKDTEVSMPSNEVAQAQGRLNNLSAERRKAESKRTFFGLGQKRKERAIKQVNAQYLEAWSENLEHLTPEFRKKLSKKAKVAIGAGAAAAGIVLGVHLGKDRIPEGVKDLAIGSAKAVASKARESAAPLKEKAAKGAELVARARNSGAAGKAAKSFKKVAAKAATKAAAAAQARRTADK